MLDEKISIKENEKDEVEEKNELLKIIETLAQESHTYLYKMDQPVNCEFDTSKNQITFKNIAGKFNFYQTGVLPKKKIHFELRMMKNEENKDCEKCIAIGIKGDSIKYEDDI